MASHTAEDGAQVHRFGEFRVDLATRELFRGDDEIKIPPKSMGCLQFLLEHRDRAVGRDELIDAVWGHDHLSDGVLAQTIFQLRRVLEDGDGARCIKTIRGFGYRWVAELDPVHPAPDQPATLADGSLAQVTRALPEPNGRQPWSILLAVGMALVLAAASVWWLRDRSSETLMATAIADTGAIVLLLPVDTSDAPEHAWIRLGLMDLLAGRLREAGQTVVPSDTVIAMLRGHVNQGDAELARRLADSTGSRLVFRPRARQVGQRWTVSLHELLAEPPGRSSRAEADDVLSAAQHAADQLASILGLTPAPSVDEETGIRLLLQRTEAALLDQHLDEARDLLDQAAPSLRAHPEVRLQRGRVAFARLDLDLALAELQALHRDLDGSEPPRLHLRLLSQLASVLGVLGRLEESGQFMHEAIDRFDESEYPAEIAIVRMNLGLLAQEQGDFAAAQAHMAQAQRLLQGVGDVQRHAVLAYNIGLMEARNDRPGEALRHFERALRGFSAVQSIAGELHVLAAMSEAHLMQLDTAAAVDLQDRLVALLPRNGHRIAAAYAALSRAGVLRAQGHDLKAETELTQALDSMADHPELAAYRSAARLIDVHWRFERGDASASICIDAAAVRDDLADFPHMRDRRALAWLLQVRCELQRGRLEAAEHSAIELDAWASTLQAIAPKVFAATAQAELASAKGQQAQARTAYEQALAHANASAAPVRLLQVAQSYVPWLLAQPDGRQHALVLANRLSTYGDSHFDAALVLLQVFQVLGPASTWRMAVETTETLAGERSVPAELRQPPTLASP